MRQDRLPMVTFVDLGTLYLMDPKKKQLRRKLAGLRTSQSRTRLALESAGTGSRAEKYRAKFESVSRAIRDLEGQLEVSLPEKGAGSSRLQLAVEQIVFARNYTIGLLDQTPACEWFRQPPGGVSHVAWQVGHLAIAEYRLTLERIRGAQPQDADLISKGCLRLFGPESVPDADPAMYPGQTEIRALFDRVHEHVLRELQGLDESELDQSVLKPHLFVKTKLRALLWCAQHEMLHAGQIGLLRRQLGYPPL
jgi:DinB superfamily